MGEPFTPEQEALAEPTNAQLAVGLDDLRGRLPALWGAYYPAGPESEFGLTFITAVLAMAAARLRGGVQC